MRRCLTLLGLSLLVLATGCQTIELDLTPKKWPWSKDDKDRKSQYPDPNRMVAIWTDTVRFSAGGQPTRGFGGRLYFYNDHGQAIPVEGKLAIFAYDDTNVDPEMPQEGRPPDRRFAYTQEQFTKHYSKTDLGASYSIWVPWDAAGGERRHITLLPVFTTLDGKVIVGQQTANVLPGKVAEAETIEPGVEQGGVYEGRAVGFEKVEDARRAAMKTTTISVPRNGALRPQTKPGSGATPIQVPMQGANQAPPTWQTSQSQSQYPQFEQQPAPGMTTPQTSHSPAGSLPRPGLDPVAPPAVSARGALPTRFERPRSRALGEPIGRLGRDHALSRLTPVESPSTLP